jgi:hypothetical protein
MHDTMRVVRRRADLRERVRNDRSNVAVRLVVVRADDANVEAS